jgi:hypothetical protein
LLESTNKISHEDIIKYCLSCGSTQKEVLQNMQHILETINWKSKEVNIEALIQSSHRLRRFWENWAHNIWLKMNYQDYVWIHQERMYQTILLFESELIQLWINVEILLFLARNHDNTEVLSIFWDVPTPIKKQFEAAVENIHILYERGLVQDLCTNILWAEISIEETRAMESCIEKSDTISQLLSYFDKLDALMVSLHEVLSWNSEHFLSKAEWYLDFIERVLNGTELPLLKGIIENIRVDSPLQDVFSRNLITQITWCLEYIWVKRLFQEEDIWNDHWVPLYLKWKEATLNIKQSQLWELGYSGIDILISPRS